MVAYPDLAFKSAVRGLRVWWDVVFPALLPFFVGGQVLMALGVVSFMGVLMEPFMRPLFGVPGVGSFVVAMGLASGYPIGSVLTAQLRREGQLTRTEAERLMSFTNTADPLFMAGAVAVGMFGSPALAGVIMAAHYLGALATGVCLKFYRRGDTPSPNPRQGPGNVLLRAVTALVDARRRDGRPFGQVLGDAVRESVSTLLLVGGFIILFSVIIQLLGRMGLVARAGSALAWALAPLGFSPHAVQPLVSGFFEIDLGTEAAAHAAAPLLQRVVVANVIIAWSGLSVLGQVAAVTQGTGVSILPYVVSRVLHALFSGAITLLLWNPAWESSQTAMARVGGIPGGLASSVSWLGMFEASSALFAGVLALLAAASALWLLWRGVRGCRP
jgi:sporulation integral membrane protein YlbJ